MGAIPALRDAGFSEDEIGTWANDKRQTLSGAGFSDEEIGGYFGDPQMVRPPSPGLIKRFTQGTAVGRVLGAFGKGWEDTAGQEPYGLSPETQQHLEKLPLFNAMWGPEVRTIAAGVDAANRAVQSGITGIGAAVGQAAQEFGASQGTGGRAARDVTQMLGLMPMFNGSKPMYRIERTPTGEVMSRPVGGLPREQDFTDASRILGDGTTEAQKAQVSSKLDKLYEEHGVHPAEVVHDAAHDPSIVQRLTSEGDELPERYITAYHGTPHDFERFSAEHIGEGEGSQAYGHGLYFAESEGVARSYRENLSSTKDLPPEARAKYGERLDELSQQVKELEDQRREWRAAQTGPLTPELDAKWKEWDQRVNDKAAEGSELYAKIDNEFNLHGGALYKVRINADKEHFLDWDKPIGEQSEHVQKALLEHEDPSVAGTAEKHGQVSGQAFYERLASRSSHEEASKILHDAGIPGIKYHDAVSRDAGEGTHNFVVFDDKLVDITDKNGQPVTPADRQKALTQAGIGPEAHAQADIRALIDRKATPEEIANHPYIKQAYADADTRPHTDKLPGYGTPEFEAKREFNFKGEKIVGYDAYVDRLVKQAESYSTQGPVKQERTATIVLGPPASGKSTLSERIAAETHSAIVDSDDAKLGIPEYDGGRGTPAVHEESANIGARVVERMMDEGKNIIMPLVGANPASIQKRIGILNSADYKVNLVNLDVAEDEAYRRMIGRFLKTGRIISSEYFESVDGNPKKTYYDLKGEPGVQQAVEVDGNGPPSNTLRILDGAQSELGVRLGGGGGPPPHPSDGAGSGALPQGQPRPEVPREAVSPPSPIQSEIKNGVVTLNPADLKVDAKRFQFKEGGDAAGVTDRLKDVKTWDPIKAGMVVAWEDKDGNRFIVDGHQRLALAQRIAAQDPAQNPRLNGWMLREGEGVTDVEARVIAASKNIAEGTGTAVDAAKVLRDRPDLVNELPPRSELVRQARSLSQLEDEPFLMVVNGVVPPNYAAVVGRLMPKDGAIGIDAGKFQSALLEVLAKTKPENATQAEAIVRQGIDAGTHVETQSSLFGDTDVTTSLYFERAKVLDKAIKALKHDKTVFGTLVKEAKTIEAAGSTLAKDVNAKRAQADAQAIQLIQAIANRKGPVSDALNAAAQRAKSSGKYSDGVDSFVGYIRGQAESGDLARLADGERRGLEHVGAEDAQGNVSREPPLEGAQANAEIADLFEGTPRSLGAAAAPPGSVVGPTAANTSPSLFQRTAAALKDKASGLLDIGKDIEMLVAPMARGTQQSMALAKDFANSLRRNRWEWTRVDGQLERTFNAEQRKRMWDAADEESVAIQLNESREHQGLVTLTPEERAAVVQLQARAQAAWLEARDLGMVKGEGLPSYTPRMLINATDAKSGDGPIALNSLGLNLKTRTGQMKHRQHLTAEETEDAMRAKFGENAGIARDIRALPLATAKLEDAIAGRTLVDNIRDIGKRTGDDTVTEGAAPDGTPHTWFTIDHPALKTWRPKFKLDEVTGKVEPAKDADGNIIFEQVPIYIRGDFEGPLRAVLSQKSGLVYNAAMELKGKTMSLIMNSPLIHNAVEWGRALPAMPGKVATFKVYFEGNRAKHDPVMMQEAIDAGLVPIGHRGFNQDITSIMEAPDLAPGRSWTAKVMGAVPGIFDENAGNAVKRAIDRAGDFWHNTLLWDRVGDLQMGLYSNFLDDLIAKGVDRQTSARISAHWANRYAGALPQEAMSDAARKTANLMLFSRSFTMGNLGAMKDMLTGLPRDVMAQVSRDVGSLDPKAAGYIKSLAVRKAVAVVMLDIGLLYVGNSVLQSTLNVLMNDRSVEDELRGYSRRLLGKLSQIHEHPLQLLQPFGFLQAASSTGDNEPGRENRIFIGHAKDGTAIYARNPSGKIGEEFEGYLTGPLDMLRRKLGTVARPAWQILSNDQGFGRHIYDPNADTPEEYVKNAGRIVWHLVKSQFPEGQISAAKDLATGQGDTKVNALQALGPIAGITFSKGAPGGPAVGELYRAQEQHRFAVNAALPDIRKQIKSGDIVGAVTQMTELGIPKGLQQFYLRTSINPQTRLSGRTIKDFYLYATPEQRQRFEEALHQQAAPSAH